MLSFRNLDEVIEDDMPESDNSKFNAWRHKGKKAQAFIGSALSDPELENEIERKSAK